MVLYILFLLKLTQGFRSYLSQFPGGELLCPKNHLYVPDLIPHTCIGMSAKCLGVTQVTTVQDLGQEFLCHPRFQAYPLLTSVVYDIITKRCILPTTMVYWFDQNGDLTYKCEAYTGISSCIFSHGTQSKVKCEYCFLQYTTLTCGVRMMGTNTLMIPCPKNCLTCDSAASYCLSCLPGFIPQNASDKLCSYQCREGHQTCKYDATKNLYSFTGCLVGYELKNGVCLKCPDNCETCKDGVCSKCSIHYQLLFGKCFGDQNCQNYIISYDSSNLPIGGYCQQCDFGYFNNGQICQLCNTVPGFENCFMCNNSNECRTCKAGYMLDANKNCVQHGECDPTCQTCLADQPTFCTTCDQDVEFRIRVAGGKCLCDESRQYADKDGTCVLCTEGYCQNCTQNFYECTKCKTGKYRVLVGDKCLCQQGYYDTGLADQICRVCFALCYNCAGPAYNECTECGDVNVYHRDLINGQCICTQGYTEQSLVQKIQECGKCHKRCAKCSKPTLDTDTKQYCTKCYEGQNRVLSSKQTCDCIKNFGDNFGLSDKCFQCFYSCGTCSGETQYECTTCTDSSNRYLTNTKECICKQSYYEESYGKMQCKKCHYSCLECNFLSEIDQCTLCPSTRIPDRVNLTFKCVCKDSHYFDDGQSLECRECHFSCLTCNGQLETQCLSCDTNYREKQFSKCECPIGRYDVGQLQCSNCHSTCQKCFGNLIDNCISCYTDQNRILKGNQCMCMSGYSDNNGTLPICQKCSYKCQDCLNTVDYCTSCLSDSLRILGTDHSCSCPPNLIDIIENPICQLCHYTCEYCSGGADNQCTSCKHLSFRTLNDLKQCNCDLHYYDVGYNQCQPCSNFCNECITQSNNCTSCTNERYLENNQCKCKTKSQGASLSTFQFGNQVQCLNCHYSCLTCSGISSKECLTCSDIEFRIKIDQQCVCIDNYYDAGQATCWTCSQKCKTCSLGSDNCTSCPENSLRIINTQLMKCQCPTGYFDDGINIQCQKCHYSCVSCSQYANKCEQCNQFQFRYFNSQFFTCDCLTGYFDNGIDVCQKCHYSCSECYSSGQLGCKTCRDELLSNRILINKKCGCKIGYYDDGSNIDCLKCSVSCISCETYSYNCTSCSSTRSLTANSCNCKSGYFETGQIECSQCNLNCKECQFNSNQCTDCHSNQNRILNIITNTCICQQGFTEINGVCMPCDLNCKTCNLSVDNCTDCHELSVLSGSKCQCVDGFFQSNVTQQCVICHKSCYTCNSYDTNCTSCSQINHRILKGNICECEQGYFENLQTIICEQCDPTCLTCFGTSTNCFTCNSLLNRALNSYKCVCQQGYFLDAVLNQCQSCNITCLECQSEFNCIECRSETRIYDDINKKCPCKDGYYEQNQINCIDCNQTCKKCENSSTFCTECEISFFRQLINNTCLCQDGYYDVGIDVCQKCNNTCKTCQISSTNCLSCYEAEQLRILENNVCRCKNGYFENQQRICEQCSNQCLTCQGLSDKCTSCDVNQKRIDQSIINKCPCLNGYYSDVNNLCQKCHVKCQTCFGSFDNCISCSYDLKSFRQSISGQCNCKDGYYDDGTQFYCQKCNIQCKTCIQTQSNCLTCSNNLRQNPPLCNCIDGYFENKQQMCEICSNKCSTCILEPNNCLTCKIGRQGNDCLCEDGYFEAGLINCQVCGFQCSTCITNSSNCLTCKGDRINSPYCQCPDGYYDDYTNENCQICDYTCSLCDIDGCLSCAGNRILSEQKICEPPPDSVSYTNTPWCSTCDVAVLKIYFSDDLNSILVDFDFPLNPKVFESYFKTNICNQIIEISTFNKLGNNPQCRINNQFQNQLIIQLGQNAQINIQDEINFKINVLKHINCEIKLQIFIFNIVKLPKVFMNPIVEYKLPKNKISPCYDYYVNQILQDIDGKRKLSNIKWSYQIIDQQSNFPELDLLVEQNTNTQQLNLIILENTLPKSSEIRFSVSFTNFIGSTSIKQFSIMTNSGDYPSISILTKNQYMTFQLIVIDLVILTKYCTGTASDQVENRSIAFKILEITRNPTDSQTSNLNFSDSSNQRTHKIKIPQYSLSPNTVYTFQTEIQDLDLNHTYIEDFDINIIPADLMCDFDQTPSIQNFKKDLFINIRCKDLDYKFDWNVDQEIITNMKCIDQTTSDVCRNQNGKPINVNSTSTEQFIKKFTFLPYSIQIWEVQVTKGNKKKIIKQSIVYLDDNIQEQQMEFNSAYQMRPINNYEQITFKYILDELDKSRLLEFSVAIIYDYEIIKILRPQYKVWKTKIYNNFQKFNLGDEFNLRFSAQFTNSIMPKLKSLSLSINQPPICQSLIVKQDVGTYGLIQTDISVNCEVSEDSPYYYQLKQFLSDQDYQLYLEIGTDNSLLYQKFQTVNKFSELLSLSIDQQTIIILVQVLDQKGSVTNLFSVTQFPSQQVTCLQDLPSQLSIKTQLSILIQALKGKCSDVANIIKDQFVQSLLDLSNQEIHLISKGIQIYNQMTLKKKIQKQSQRFLEEIPVLEEYCYNQENKNFQNLLNTKDNNIISEPNTLDIITSSNQIKSIMSKLRKKLYDIQQQLSEDTFLWNEQLIQEEKNILSLITTQIYLIDDLFVKISQKKSSDDEIFQQNLELINQINEISSEISIENQVNQEQLQIDGNQLALKLRKFTIEQISDRFSINLAYEKNIIDYFQIEELHFQNFNPYNYSQQLVQEIQSELKFSNIEIFQGPFSRNVFTNYLNSGSVIKVKQFYTNFSVFQIKTKQCDENHQLTSYFNFVCINIQEYQNMKICNMDLKQDYNKTIVTCFCEYLGDIFLVKNLSQLGQTEQEVPLIIENNISPQIFTQGLFYFTMIITVIFLSIFGVSLIIEFRTNFQQQKKLETGIEFSQILYPNHMFILKQNFKFIHQCLALFYFQDKTIKKSFLILKFFSQIASIQAISFMEISKIKIDNVFQFILLLTLNVFTFEFLRFVNKFIEAMYRFQGVAQILSYILLCLELFLPNVIYLTLNNIQNDQIIIYVQLVIYSLLIAQIIIEPLIILVRIILYKNLIYHFRVKLFNPIYHFIYFFVIHQRLEEIMNIYIQL